MFSRDQVGNQGRGQSFGPPIVKDEKKVGTISDSELGDTFMQLNKKTTDRVRLRRTFVVVVAIALGGGLISISYAQSGISLNSPVSFPVDI